MQKKLRYGPHEIKVITKLVQKLQESNIMEDSYGTYRALIVMILYVPASMSTLVMIITR